MPALSPRGRQIAAYAAVLSAVVLWGISFVATKAALAELTPVTLVFARFALGVAVLGGLLAARRQSPIPPRDCWLPVALMGFVGVFVHQLLQSYGLVAATATNAGWLIALIPLWSAILGAIFLGEVMRSWQVAGLAMGFAGAVVVIAGERDLAEVLRLPSTLGELLILASTVNWAVYTIIGRDTLARLGALRATTASMAVGLVMLLPVALVDGGWREVSTLSVGGWVAVLFLGIGCSAVGYLCWYFALRWLEAARVAAFLYLEPFVTVAAAGWLLGERFGVLAFAGGVLVLVGVALVQHDKR